MTGISPDLVFSATSSHTSASLLAIGSKVAAKVVGPTRSGLAVRVDGTSFTLNTEAKFQSTDILTIKVAEKIDEGHHKVQIVALNDQPLKRTIQGDLAHGSPTTISRANSTTIAVSRQIDVDAQLVSKDGKPYGPPIAIRLSLTSGHDGSSPGQVLESSKTTHQPNLQRMPMVPRPDQSATSLGNLHGGKEPDARNSAEPASQGPLRSASAAGLLPASVTQEMTTKLASLPQTVAATVLGRVVNSGQLLLSTDNGVVFQSEQPIDLPVGTPLRLTFGSVDALMADSQYFSDKGLLTQLIELLEGGGPRDQGLDRARQSAAHQLPRPDRQLAANLLQFFNLQSGSLSNEAGLSPKGGDNISSSKHSILQGVLSDIGQTTSESLADGWRGTTLPLGPDPAQAIAIYYRENMLSSDDESGHAEGDDDQDLIQRAVFDVTFRHLGRCQIDTLCQKQRFDLLIRSEQKLEAVDRLRLTDLFQSACDITGCQGEITYRQGDFIELSKKAKPQHIVTT